MLQGALLFVPADSSYMGSTSPELMVSDGRIVVQGRCSTASGALGVVARMRSSDAGRSGYALLAQPGTRSFVVIDFRVSARENHFRILHGWERTGALLGPGERNIVELRHVGQTLQAVINGVLVATVVDGRHDRGASGWAVRSYGAGAEVLLTDIEISEVSAAEGDAEPWSPAPHAVRHHPGVAAIHEPWTPSPHAQRHPAALAARPSPPPPVVQHLPPPVDDPLMGGASRLAEQAHIAAMLRDSDVWARHAAARHPSCSTVLLMKLASDVEWVVRLVVASRSDCPALALDRLGSDEKALVRHAVALNPVCPVTLLERLTMDRNRDIDRAVARHPRCPPGLRARLEQRWGERLRRNAVALDRCEVPWQSAPSS